MSRKQFALTLLLAVFAGLTGGVGGSWFFAGEPAFAQKTSKGKVIEADVVKAKDIYLLDDTGGRPHSPQRNIPDVDTHLGKG